MADKLYAQYRDKPKAKKLSDIPLDFREQITSACDHVKLSYSIDQASGEALNVIGRIVDVDRSFVAFLDFKPKTQFGGESVQFGGLSSMFNQTGRSMTQEIENAAYRVLLKAKIAKNNNDATIDGIADALSFITKSAPISVIDNDDMTFSVAFGEELDPVEKLILTNFDILPRPQGVKFAGYTEEATLTQFGGRFGFGDSRAQFGFYFGA